MMYPYDMPYCVLMCLIIMPFHQQDNLGDRAATYLVLRLSFFI